MVRAGLLRCPALHSVLPLRARFAMKALDVKALGVGMRGASRRDHSESPRDHFGVRKECGMCIDICPVGALTSGDVPL